MALITVEILGVAAKGPFAPMGDYVRRARQRAGLNQGQLAEKAGMRPAQLSALENGANVEIRFYELVARALNFRGVIELFTSGGDDQTRRLLRLWRALPTDEARTDVLRLMKDSIVREGE